MSAVLERARASAEERSTGPGFLQARDERGLFPELTPDPTIVGKIHRIDPRWRVEWHRSLGRWCLFHDHERFGRAQVPTVIVQTKDGEYMPLDERTVRQLEFGAWAERNFRDAAHFDEHIEQLLEEEQERIEEHNRAQRVHWLKTNAKKMIRSIKDGNFFDETPSPVGF